MRGGKVMTREMYADAMRFWDLPQDSIERWKREAEHRNGDDDANYTLNIRLHIDGNHRTMTVRYPARTLDKYWGADQKISAVLARTWQDVLQRKIEYCGPGYDLDSRWPTPPKKQLKPAALL